MQSVNPTAIVEQMDSFGWSILTRKLHLRRAQQIAAGLNAAAPGSARVVSCNSAARKIMLAEAAR